MKDKLTVKEAADYLNTTRQKISRMLRKGFLKAEVNPLDTRYKLIDRIALDRVKQYAQYLIDGDDKEKEAEPGEARALVA